MNWPQKKYAVIYADPPWPYSSRQYQSDGRHFKELDRDYYETMSLDQIKAMPVADISAKDCALFLWVTNSHLKEGLEVIEAWGFRYVTIAFVWVKRYSTGSRCSNYAPWTMQSCEVCLLGVKNHPIRVKKNVNQLVEAVRTEHSRKPDKVRSMIERLMGEVPRIELFSRERIEGWDVWGNELPSTVQTRLEPTCVVYEVDLPKGRESK